MHLQKTCELHRDDQRLAAESIAEQGHEGARKEGADLNPPAPA